MRSGGTGKDLIFVPSGGQGADEALAESASMKRYLVEHGVPETQILEENRSATTFENMKFSKALIEAAKPDGKVLFSTNSYHIFRSGLFARRVKLRAVGIGARAKWYFWPNAAVRELIGLLTKHKGKQAAVLAGLTGIYALLVWLMYHE